MEPEMKELIWLEGYSGQTVDELIALEGTHRVDSLVCAFEEALWAKLEREGGDSLSEEESTVIAVEGLERELNNGGYLQFFERCPFLVHVVVDSMRRIDCPKMAAITEEAVNALKLAEFSEEAVGAAVEAGGAQLEEALGKLDERFLEYPESIENQLFSYLKQHRKGVRF